jgi:cytoskeletal protein RodZ
MNEAPTPDGRGQDRPRDAEPFFPSEGTFNPVVPLSEIGRRPANLPAVDPADVGRPAEAAWAREAHRARLKEEEETLVPARNRRARGVRRPWLVPASVIALSVAAGLASGSYLIWSSQRAQQSQPPARVAAEATAPAPAPDASPAPAAEQEAAATKSEKAGEPARDERPGEVAKAEKSSGPAPAKGAQRQEPPPPQPAPRAERAARAAAAEAKEATPAPKPARTQSAPTPRPRVSTAETHPPARTPPISSPPPSARSKKVIQWP